MKNSKLRCFAMLQLNNSNKNLLKFQKQKITLFGTTCNKKLLARSGYGA